MTQFEVGKIYACRSIADYDTIYSFPILSRTEKTITTVVQGDIVKRGLRIWDDVEKFSPFGRHSMFPVISADREAKDIKS
ncbi:MAG: hypothetical protein V4808_16080 [Pseudomonadota bacterium]